MNNHNQEVSANLIISMCTIGIVLNIALGSIISILKLPIYVDAVGTIFITLLLGWRVGVLVGVASFALMSVLINPVYIYFIGTQVVIVTYVYFIANKWNLVNNIFMVILFGLGLGIVAAIASAPVIVYVFGGVAGNGRDVITAVIMNSGTQVIKAVLLSGAASEPIDKTIQLSLAFMLVRNAPEIIHKRLHSSHILKNKFFDKSGN